MTSPPSSEYRSPTEPGALLDQSCGRRIGRYTLLRRIAHGGMAEVYLARTTSASDGDRPVAIKKILPQYADNARFIEMLKDEAKITVSLTHPNIAQVFELGRDGPDYFLAMEYVAGRPLNKLLQRADEADLGCIPVPHAAFIMAEIAKGLDHAHRRTDGQGRNLNIVHRDVSPQNVLISYAGEVKLIDFGIARAEGRMNRTQQGIIKGKLRYLAPEIASGREPDHRADVFCCGIVLFEMLTGEAMFAPRSDHEAIELATEARVKSPRSRNANVPEALDAIVIRALRKDREDRYPSAGHLHRALIDFLVEHEPTHAGPASLAPFMRALFRPEMRLDEALDAAAVAVADAAPAVTDAPTMTAEADTPIRYQALVTRMHGADEATLAGQPLVMLSGADGGEAMEVVPADAPPPAVAGSVYTRPPVSRAATETASFSDLEPTEEETGARPAPRRPARSGATGLAVPTLMRRPWGRGPAIVGLAVVALLGVVGMALGLSGLSEPEPVVIPPAARPAPVRAKPLPAPEPAVLSLLVDPEVPISVRVDGRLAHSGATAPVVIPNLAPHRIHRVSIAAEGFEEITLSRALRPGEERTIELTLTPSTGTIRVLSPPGPIRATAGRVEGDRVLDVPLGRPVVLTVGRPGGRPYRRTLTLQTPKEVRLSVPLRRARGTLAVTSEPASVVYVDGRRRGRTPLTLRLPAGQHRIVLESPSGRTLSVRRSVKAGRTTTFVYRWPR